MKFDLLAKLLLEMPAKNVERLGSEDDWETRGPYDKKSHILLTDPKFEAKIFKAFSKSDPDLNFYFINRKEMVEDLDDTVGYSTMERGEVGPSDDFWNLIGIDYDEVHDPDGITIIFNGNFGDQLVELTPWIIAHRLSHSLQSSTINNKFSGVSSAYEQMVDSVKYIISDVSEHYGMDRKIGTLRRDWAYKESTLPYVNAILNSIGLFASARNGKINRPYEFIHEVVAQYLITGEVKLREDLPEQIKIVDQEEAKYYPKGEGEENYTMYFQYEQIEGYDAAMNGHSRTLEHYVEDIFSSATGSVYLM